MRAVVYDEVGAPPVVREVPEPDCPPDGVVVAVTATGVCRSDWHAWMGHDPVALPHVPGHELVGTVAAVGPQVTRWQVGDRVTAPFVCGCGTCGVCRGGDPQVCPAQTQPGFTHWGSFAEQVALHAADFNLVALPDGIGDAAAASLGCRFATAYRGVAIQGGLAEGEWLAVHGTGGVGLSALLIGKALGAQVVAVDVADEALATARSLGADALVDARGLTPEQVGEAVHAATTGGAHVSIDACGSPATAVASVRSLRRRGRHIQAGLLLGPESTPPLPMDRVVGWELGVLGTHGLAAADYPAMLGLVARGIPLDAIVGGTVGLDEAPAALLALGGPPARGGITVVDPRR
ncbi:MAG: zinc-dependent alcohol dehydrogenase family protein [Micrococcales bacterium]|nr:zinc-dependent alcohol dehydrogenase family protein [Micrococcales bacterium]